MPYRSIDQLPPSVRNHLPLHAQDINRETFNHAWTSYAHSGRQEQIAPSGGVDGSEAPVPQGLRWDLASR